MKVERKMPRMTLCALAVLGTVLPGVALAEDPGIRVVIRVPADVAVPDPEALLTRMTPPGSRGTHGKMTVAVHKKVENSISETRIDLWGKAIPQPEIEGALRTGFPALAGAEIIVSSVDASEKPAVPEECKGVRKGGKCRVVKKEERKR